MGFLTVGPYGPLSGRTGNTVGRITKNGNVFAARPRKSSKAPTQLQLDVRSKFKLLPEFLSFLADLVNVGFADYDSRMSPMNAAIKFNYNRAITGVAPNFSLDLSKVMYSRGTKVAKPTSPVVGSQSGAELSFSWAPVTTESESIKKLDRATFVVYDVEQEDFVILKDVVTREGGAYTLQLPQSFTGDTVHCYMHFTSVDKDVSNSVYVGNVTVL